MSDAFVTLNAEQNERAEFPSPGRCIYCLSADKKLTDEHVVPYGLGGDAVIFRKASCEECAREINRYESVVLQKALGRQRLQLDTPTRNRKSRPEKIPHEFALLDGHRKIVRTVVRHLTWQESILTHTGWQAPPVGILTGRSPTDQIEGRPWYYCDGERVSEVQAEVKAETGHDGEVAFKVGDVHQGALLRFMAKTAHAFAAAKLGLDGFKPLLADIILNRSNTLTYFVGASDAPEPVGDTNSFEMKCGEYPVGDKRYVVVWLRLFGLLGGPAYVVAVGEALNPERE